MLAVVQYQQQLSVSDLACGALKLCLTRQFAAEQRGEHCGRHVLARLETCQFRHHDAVAVGAGYRQSRLFGKPTLAHSARAGQR